jgi:hypothetical protein
VQLSPTTLSNKPEQCTRHCTVGSDEYGLFEKMSCKKSNMTENCLRIRFQYIGFT